MLLLAGTELPQVKLEIALSKVSGVVGCKNIPRAPCPQARNRLRVLTAQVGWRSRRRDGQQRTEIPAEGQFWPLHIYVSIQVSFKQAARRTLFLFVQVALCVVGQLHGLGGVSCGGLRFALLGDGLGVLNSQR